MPYPMGQPYVEHDSCVSAEGEGNLGMVHGTV